MYLLWLQDMNIVVDALQTYGEELKQEAAYAMESAQEGKWGQVCAWYMDSPLDFWKRWFEYHISLVISVM